METLVLAAIVVAPLLMQFFLHSNAALAFLALCAGAALQQQLGNIYGSYGGQIVGDFTGGAVVGIAVISLPFLLTIFLTIGQAKGAAKFLQLAPAAAASGFYALLVVPLLASDYLPSIAFNNQPWEYLQKAQLVIVVTGVIFSLLIVLLVKSGHKADKHK